MAAIIQRLGLAPYRNRRRVLVCDDGEYRNDASRALHGYLTRDGVHPAELRRIGREQLTRYEIEIRSVHVRDARALQPGLTRAAIFFRSRAR